jgi:hypothetical protein
VILYPVQGGGGRSTKERFGVTLTGTYNGSNREFALPEPVLHNPPNVAVRLYNGGRRVKMEEFELFESVPGAGLDRVRILQFAPRSTGRLFADYQAA